MAVRPVFYVSEDAVFRRDVSFTWFSGFAKSQKQKSIRSLHEEAARKDPSLKPLEISTKSENAFGRALSAFSLKLDGTYLENVFQSSKVFENGGPYRDLLTVDPRDAKRDERIRTSGNLVSFSYDGKEFPLIPRTLFYDYIYVKAVLSSGIDYKQLKEYNGFTDIEFNPERSINTQAKAAAELKLMVEEGMDPEEMVNHPDQFLAWHKKKVK